MTPLAVTLTVAAALGLAGVIVVLLRLHVRAAEPLLLTYDTKASHTKHGWAAFWARDPFIAAQRKRTGAAFATYEVPGGSTIAVHLAAADFRHHTFVAGGTGTGKSSLLETFAVQHLQHGRPFALIDLHGDLYDRVATWADVVAPAKVTKIDFTKPDSLPSFNPLVPLPGVDVGRQVDLIVGTLKRLYASEEANSWAWGVKVEELMRYAVRAAIEARINAGVVFSLADLPQFFLLPEVRKGIVAHADPSTRVYFTTRYGAREEMYSAAVLNKVEPFLSATANYRFLSRSENTVDLFGAMDRGDTLLVNLAKGYLPSADIMGRLLVNVLRTAALRRESIRPSARKPYALLLDEAHLLAGTGSGLEEFLVAARKYRVFVTLAAQGLSLFPASFRPHLLGNTGRQFFFRMPYSEARAIAKDIFEAQGTIYREQTRPNEAITEPLLNEAEEIAWRTRDLSSLPVGVAYWMQRDRPYKARRIKILPPVRGPRRDGARHIPAHP